jgi:hypothetical protein
MERRLIFAITLPANIRLRPVVDSAVVLIAHGAMHAMVRDLQPIDA